jgi:hypothetical protein
LIKNVYLFALFLALIFLFIQLEEYFEIGFSFSERIFGRSFFIWVVFFQNSHYSEKIQKTLCINILKEERGDETLKNHETKKKKPSRIEDFRPLCVGQRHWQPSVGKLGFLTCVKCRWHPFRPQIGGTWRISPRLRIYASV